MIESEKTEQKEIVEKKKRVYKKKEAKPAPQIQAHETIPVATQDAKPEIKKVAKPRPKKEKKVKEESDEEEEVQKIKNMISSNPELKKQLEEVIKNHMN